MRLDHACWVVVLAASLSAIACGNEPLDTPPPAAAPAASKVEEPAPPDEPLSGVTDHSYAEVVDLLFEMTNEVRKQRGVQPLERHPALAEAAQKHSIEMAENDYLGHESLDGSTLRERLPADFKPKTVAENVWGGSLPPLDSVTLAKRIFDGWMGSPGHRQNIEAKDLAYLGVAVAAAGEEIRAVQVFASAP